jgi:hypothetical protein
MTRSYQFVFVATVAAVIGTALLAWLLATWWRSARAKQSNQSTHQVLTRSSVSLQAAFVPGPNSDPKQLVVRRTKWIDQKERTEQEATMTFCKLHGWLNWRFESPGVDDPVDVKTISPDGQLSEHFQLVRLWEGKAWRDLNVNGAVDRRYTEEEAIDLIRNCLTKKGARKYPADIRRGLILLIDASPVENPTQFFQGIDQTVRPFARELGYKSVWVVGTGDLLNIGQQ